MADSKESILEASAHLVAPEARDEMRYRVLSPWTIAVWAMLTLVVGVGMAVWLLLAYTGGNAEANRVQLDAIRTAGTIVVGTGGAAALLLAARRQRTGEIALKQKDRDQADVARAHALQERVAEQTRLHHERVAVATEADAEARRITDLYTKAVDQLGSDKAPVRLGGLYALERLAQDHEEQRQTIVNVLCAYLRMPYALPGDPSDDASDQVRSEHRERVQEREVRLTAQRLLADHLRPDPDLSGPAKTFWADIDLDLTGADLIDFNFFDCTVRTATFASATFTGGTTFGSATFTESATFSSAGFAGVAYFGGTTFIDEAIFTSATFTDQVIFGSAIFAGSAIYSSATFGRDTYFDSVTFTGDTYFDSATFAQGLPPEIKPFWQPPLDESARLSV